MSRTLRELPTPEEERDLHRRLVERDPVASSDLTVAYLEHLVDWLKQKNSRSIDEHHILEAAGTAIIALIKNPNSFQSDFDKSLLSYLQMSASGDLKNCLAKQARRSAREVSLVAVELSLDAGNVLAETDNPLEWIALREEIERLNNNVLPMLREGLSVEELACFELLLTGERRTGPYARALGIEQLEIEEQRDRVKQVKDKLQRRITRGRSRHGASS